jgi:hypothetical protein
MAHPEIVGLISLFGGWFIAFVIVPLATRKR